MNSSAMSILNAGLWMLIVFLAFFMQVMPFLFVLTLINISFGVSSDVALVLIPIVCFAMLIGGCLYASGRARNKLPAPLSDYSTGNTADGLEGLVTCMLPHSRRYRMR
jgi:hypothetical protein